MTIRSVTVRLFACLVALLILPLSASAQTSLSVTPTSISLQAAEGDSLPSQTLDIRNDGNQALKWSIDPTASWLSVSPTSGVQHDRVTVSFPSSSSLVAGTYQTSITVRDNSGDAVTVNVVAQISGGGAPSPPPPPPPPPSGASPDGTRVPPASQIVDNQGSVWTIANQVILRNGQDTSGRGSIMTWCGSQIRVLGTDSQWWLWGGAGWSAIGVTDPCGGGAALPPSGSDVTFYVSPSGSDSNAGTQSSPVQTIQKGLALANLYNGNGQSTRVYLAAGVYRESLTLNSGQATTAAMTIEGAPGAILSGADLWSSGWTSVGNNTYTHAWPYRWGQKPIPGGWDYYWTNDGNGSIRNRVLRSEMMFVNDQPFGNRLSASELVPGTFYVDEGSGTIRVMLLSSQTLPIANYQVDVAVRLPLLYINNRRNLTIKSLTIEKGRGALQDTMASVFSSTNIVFDGVTVRYAGASALGTQYNQGLTIRNSSFIDNGILGLSAQRDKGSLLEDSVIARNNWRGWANLVQGFESVFKWGAMRDAVVRRTQFLDNYGSGLWLDYDNQRITADQLLIARNQGAGVTMEMNPGPVTITNSKICSNITGVEDARTNYLTLTGNQVFSNSSVQLLFTGSPTPVNVPDWETGVIHTTASLYHVYSGNTFYGSGAFTTNILGTGGWLVWGPIRDLYYSYFRPTIRSDNNIWYHANRTNAFAIDGLDNLSTNFWNGTLDLLRGPDHWNNVSNPNRPNNESHSTWSNPGTLSCN